MSNYDGITKEELRASLVRTARLILKLEEDGVLLGETPGLLELFGELRQMLFAYEVRCTGNLVPDPVEGDEDEEGEADRDLTVEDSLRVVREALEREQELQDELRDPFFHDDEK
jgi:hypothetical protein